MTREPTPEQLSAAMLAYDMELPEGAGRPALPAHVAALRAALIAALSKEDSSCAKQHESTTK